MELPSINTSTVGHASSFMPLPYRQPTFDVKMSNLGVAGTVVVDQPLGTFLPQSALPMAATPPLRLVRIVIIDNDAKLDAKLRVLTEVPERWTDATDQELFYELPIVQLLAEHNGRRVTANMDSIRIRDLVMQVITVANIPSR